MGRNALIRPALTDEVVAALEPKGVRSRVGDGDCQGLFLEVTPAGAKIWMVVGRDQMGSHRNLRLGRFPEMTVEAARASAVAATLVLGWGQTPDPVVKLQGKISRSQAMLAALQAQLDTLKSGSKS